MAKKEKKKKGREPINVGLTKKLLHLHPDVVKVFDHIAVDLDSDCKNLMQQVLTDYATKHKP